MIKIDYTFKTKQPLHTGSDENVGILRTLRREKILINDQRPLKSRFLPEQRKLKRQAVALLLLRLWDKMDDRARVTIYDEIAGKLLSSSSCPNKEEFLQTICKKLKIREVTTDLNRRFDVVDILELFDDYEFLDMVRRESQYIMTMFRKIKDETIVWNKQFGGKSKVAKETVFGEETIISPDVLIQNELEKIYAQPWAEYTNGERVEYVPTIMGNSIRGVLRRICMYNFCEQVGITALDDVWYHRLFTGGTIDDSTGFEDVTQKRKLIDLCPMIGLFGCAIGNQTIQGSLRVGQAKLKCLENGNGQQSHYNLTNIIFGTRLDSEKTENLIIVNQTDSTATHQMLYEYEVINRGAEFEHSLACVSQDPLIQSAFLQMIELFKSDPYITAKESIGHGELDLTNLIYTSDIGNLRYLEHLKLNKEAIGQFFKSKL